MEILLYFILTRVGLILLTKTILFILFEIVKNYLD